MSATTKNNTIKVKFLAKTAQQKSEVIIYNPVPIESYYVYIFWKKGNEFLPFTKSNIQNVKVPVVAKPELGNESFCDYNFVRKATYYLYFSGVDLNLSLEDATELAKKKGHMFLKIRALKQKIELDHSLFYWIFIFQKIEAEYNNKYEAFKYVYELISNIKNPKNKEEEWLVNNPRIVLPDGNPCLLRDFVRYTYTIIKTKKEHWKKRITEISTNTVELLQKRDGPILAKCNGSTAAHQYVSKNMDYSANIHAYVLKTIKKEELEANTFKISDVFEEHFYTTNISIQAGYDFMDLLSGVNNSFSYVSDTQINFSQCENDLLEALKPVQENTSVKQVTKDVIHNNNVKGMTKALGNMIGTYIPTTKLINKFGVVQKEELKPGAALTNEKYYLLLYHKADRTLTPVMSLRLNTRLFVHNKPIPGWYYVTTDNGIFGYVLSNGVNLRMPDSNSKLYKIRTGDTATSIGSKVKEAGDDIRYIAHVLMHINNPYNKQKSASVRVKNEGIDILRTLQLSNYKSIEVIAGYWIWLPSRALIEALLGVVHSGSITTEIRNKLKPLNKSVSEFIDEWLPIGAGASLDLSAGISFGIPYTKVGHIGGKVEAYVGGNIDSYIYRKSDNIITISRIRSIEASAEIGADSELSMGAFTVGDAKGSNFNPNVGFSAEAYANISLSTHLEYDFEFKEDLATLGLLYVAISPYITATSMGIGKIANCLLDILAKYLLEPEKYINKIKIFIECEAGISANAFAGLSIKDDTSEAELHPSLSKGKVSLSSNKLKKMMPDLSGNLLAAGSFLVGMEIDKSENEFSKFVQANAQLNIDSSTSYYSGLLNKELDIGFKITERKTT